MNFSNKVIHKDININSYITLLKLIRDNEYPAIKFNEIDQFDKYIIIRHDIDIDLHCAYEISKIEHRYNINSTFFTMLRNPLYNALSHNNISILKKMLDMGHDIGLHFDSSIYKIKTKKELINKIEHEIDELSYYLESKVFYLSFHQPLPDKLKMNIFLKDKFESVYNKGYFHDIRYIADSMGQWREESILDLIRENQTNKIQFLAHPGLWFNADKLKLKERLKAIINAQCKRKEIEMRLTLNDHRRGVILFE